MERFDDFDELLFDMSAERRSRRAYAPPRQKETDTSTVELSTAHGETATRSGTAAPERKLRTARYTPTATSSGVSSAPSPAKVLSEYSPNGSFIKRVRVISWPTSGGFYEKFAVDAAESHRRHGTRAPHVPFFSYLPRYAQMNSAQWAYYLYMKERAACGVGLPEADLSYVILYIYEIINLEGVIPPEQGAATLASVWMLYRRVHPMLDKYMSEWLADYCLIHGLPLPRILYPDIASLAAPSTVKELYAESVLADVRSEMGHLLRLSLADYSFQKSRYASKLEDFEKRCCRVFDETVAEQLRDGVGVFDERLLRHITVKRTAFCGALCASKFKRTLELELVTPFHSPVVRRVVTELMKGAENAVRAGLGIRSRLSAPPLEGKAAAAARETAREKEYLEQYDAPTLTLSAVRAARLEELSWRNAEILTDAQQNASVSDACTPTVLPDEKQTTRQSTANERHCTEHADNGDSPTCDVSTIDAPIDAPRMTNGKSAALDSVDASGALGKISEKSSCGTADTSVTESDATLRRLLGEQLYSLLRAAADGSSFADACRLAELFADDVARRINELAVDLVGDVLLEPDGTDYAFVEDYREFL